MKSLSQHVTEAMHFDGGSDTAFYGKINGKLKWDVTLARDEAEAFGDPKALCANCGGWNYAAVYDPNGYTNGNKIVFWSPEFSWAFYSCVADIKRFDCPWAAFGVDQLSEADRANQDKFARVCLDNWDNFLGEAATIGELKDVKAPKQVQDILKEYVEQVVNK